MLVYLHGFNSSPRSFKATLLKQKLDTLKLGHLFACPALPHRPAQAMRLLEQRMQAVTRARSRSLVVLSADSMPPTWWKSIPARPCS